MAKNIVFIKSVIARFKSHNVEILSTVYTRSSVRSLKALFNVWYVKPGHRMWTRDVLT